jgi:hypothetical protein
MTGRTWTEVRRCAQSAPRRAVAVRAAYSQAALLLALAEPSAAGGDDIVLQLVPPGVADLALLDALARLTLHARRSGGALRIYDGGTSLRELARLTGLAEVIPLVGVGRSQSLSGRPNRSNSSCPR